MAGSLDPELEALVSEWITFNSSLPSGGEPHFAADTHLKLLLFDDPLLAWAVVLRIAACTSEPYILEQLGAGRVEDILTHEPERFVPIAIAEAKNNPQLREALASVWLCSHHASENLLAALEAEIPGFTRLSECGCPAEGEDD